jgi:dTDP-glucose pyrophosphorylase
MSLSTFSARITTPRGDRGAMGVEKAVILAAGRGTRMREADSGASLSSAQALAADSGLKAMVPFHGRPFLDYVIRALVQAGIREVCLVVAPGHRSILEAVANPGRGIQVTCAVQPEASGTADAVLAAEAFVAGENFLALNADNYYPVSALRALQDLAGPGLPVFERERLVRQSNIPRERVIRYAVLRVGSDDILERIVEKPDASELESPDRPVLVSMNLWRFSPAIFEACRRVGVSSRGERELPEAVQFAITQLHQRFQAVSCEDGVLDLSTRSDVAPVAQRLSALAAVP